MAKEDFWENDAPAESTTPAKSGGDFWLSDAPVDAAPDTGDESSRLAVRYPAPTERTFGGTMRDIGVTALKGAVGLPQSVAGLADLAEVATPAYVIRSLRESIQSGKFKPADIGVYSKALEDSGIRFDDAQKILDNEFSEAQKAASSRVQNAEGFSGTAKALIQNPSVPAVAIGESLPQMLGGSVMARGAMAVAPKLAPWMAGGAGEGAMAAGSAAAASREASADGTISPRQAAAAIGTGAGTAVLGAAGGKLAQRVGLPDVDTMLATGKLAGSPVGFAKAVIGSGISEGAFEEMPQSAQEQMWQNWSNRKPVLEGVDKAAAQGLVTGAAMGAGAGGASAAASLRKPIDRTPQIEALRKSGDETAAALIEQRQQKEQAAYSTDRETQALEQFFPEIAQRYREVRMSGAKTGDAVVQTAARWNFDQAAQMAGLSPKAQEVIGAKLAEIPPEKAASFVQKAITGLVQAGQAQPFDGMDTLAQTIEAQRDQMLDSVLATMNDIETLEQQDAQEPAQGQAEAATSDAVPAAAVPDGADAVSGGNEPGAVPALSEEWQQFPEQTGTLAVPRAEMPQVKTVHRGPLVNFLNARGVAHESVEVDPADLKPTQAEFSQTKVQEAADRDTDRAILISSDGHIIDGHHQAIAKLQNGKPVRAILLDAPAAELLPMVREFPSSTTEQADVQDAPQQPTGTEAQATPDQAQPAAGNAAVADMGIPTTGTTGDVQAAGVTLKDGARITFSDQPAPKAFSSLVRSEFGEPKAVIATNEAGEEVGRLTFMPNGGPIDSYVREQDRRRGVGTALYDELEARGGKLPPVDSGVAISDDARAFRAARSALSQPNPETSQKPSNGAAPASQPELLGQNSQPMSEGGKPFKTELAARKEKKLHPDKRVVKAPGGKGFVLKPMTAKQIAAQEAAARRIKGADTGEKGPLSAHGFILARGGLAKSSMADAGFDKNVRIGNRWLFTDAGKTLAQAGEALKEAGYVTEETENAASDVIRRSIASPQYTADGWDAVAEAEAQTRFEDHLKAQQESEEDPFATLADHGYTEEDTAGTGYEQASPEIQAEVAALSSQLEAMGEDSESIRERVALQYPDATQQEYHEHVKAAITQAIAEAAQPAGRGDPGKDDGEQGQAREGTGESLTDRPDGTLSVTGDTKALRERLTAAGIPAKSILPSATGVVVGKTQAAKARKVLEAPTLTAPTKADIKSQQDRAAQADKLDERAQVKRESEVGDSTFMTGFTGDGRQDTTGDIFGGVTQEELAPVQRSIEDMRRELIDLENKIVGAAGMAPGFIEDAMKSRKVPAQLKQQRNDLRDKMREDRGRVDAAPKAIDNFGEALPPARRNMAAKLDEELSDDDIATRPLSEIWPQAENEAIEDTFAAAVAHAARAEVPAKPRVAYKLKRWVETVKTVRSLAGMIVSGRTTRERMAADIEGPRKSLKDWWSKVLLLEQVPRDQWKRIGEVQERPDAFTYVDGKQVAKPLLRLEIDGKPHYLRTDGTVNGNLDEVRTLLGAQAPEKRMEFEVRGPKGGPYKVNKKGDGKYRELMRFPTSAEAFAAIKDDYASLVAAWEAIKDRDNITERDLRTAENRPRVGRDWRNGQDVTPEQFQQQFGFRGGEFGKWVQQGKGDKERQALLNGTYDALMDLSQLVGVPPRAISLNGTLGIAFGSRGSGWASAHFEPTNLVINLTKTRGAGALAHEWFHAMDNYFSRLRGGEVPFKGDNRAYRDSNYITHKPEPLMVRKDRSGYWPPMTAGKLEAMRQKNPTAVQYAADKWMPDPNHRAGVRPEVEERFAALVQALNDSPMAKRARDLDDTKTGEGYWSRTLERAARAFESHIQARMMEDGYHNDFLANVVPAEATNRNPARYPYLLPDEVKPIAQAFDALFATVQTREDDAGNVALFSVDGTSNAGDTSPDATGPSNNLKDAQRAAIKRLERSIREQSGNSAYVLEPVEQVAGAGREFHFARNIVREAFGIEVTPVRQIGGRVFNGAQVGDHILIDVRTVKPAMVVVGHELLHQLRRDDPQLYSFLKVQIERLLNDGAAKGYAETLRKRYEALDLKALNDDTAFEELLADIVGDQFGQREFWDAMGQKAPNRVVALARKVLEFFDRLLNIGREKFPFETDRYLKDIEAARQVVADVLAEYSGDKTGRSGADSDPKLAVAYHGTPYRFDKFTTDKMGTGEGAQAYGWGLYMASRRDIAEHYRERLSNDGGRGLSIAGKVPASGNEGLSNSSWAAAKGLSELLVSDAKVVQPFGSLDVVSQNRVLSMVRDLIKDDKVLDAVVRFVPVDVVNVLAGKKYAPEYLLDHPTMLVYLLPVDANDLVAAHVPAVNVLAQAVTLAAAKVHTGLARFDVGPGDFTTATGALHDGVPEAVSSNIPHPSEFSKGQLYTVEIPEDTEMLLWDKPLSAQPAKVREALKQIAGTMPGRWETGAMGERKFVDQGRKIMLALDSGTITGEQLYTSLAQQYSKPEKAPGWGSVSTDSDGRAWSGQQAASMALAEAGVRGIKYLDGVSRNKALRDVKREFLEELPEDADFDEVMDLVGTGAFSPKNDDVIKALAADDWLGFDYPSQALSAALSGKLGNYDASPALVRAVAATQDDSTYNYVVFSGDDVAIQQTHYSIADQTETPAFRAWFGDSMARERMTSSKQRFADMPPLVMYHTTRDASFTAFEAGRPTINSTTFGDVETSRAAIFFTPSVADSNAYGALSDGRTVKGAATMPVYLKAENPLWLSEGLDEEDAQKLIAAGLTSRFVYNAIGHWSMFDDTKGKDLVEAFKRAGYDSVVFNDQNPVTGDSFESWAVFEPTQIKSATGNRGTFDQNDSDIRFSIADKSPASIKAEKAIDAAKPAQAEMFQPGFWDAPQETRLDKVIYELADGRVDLKRVQEAITKAKAIPEKFDARLAETLYPGRVATRSEKFLNDEAKPLLDAMARNNVTMDELADYLHARHAEERNKQIAKVNPDLPDGGAGKNSKGVLMTTEAAKAHIAGLSEGKRMVLTAMAKRVDSITQGTTKLLVEEGLEKQETIDAWTGAYKSYVPLFRDEAENGNPHPSGSGMSVRGGSSKRAVGSKKKATNILAHVLMQREAAITRAEKNRVAVALYGLALTNPNPDFWTTIKPSMSPKAIGQELQRMGVDPTVAEAGMQGVPTIKTVDPTLGRVVSRPNPMYKSLPGAIVLKVNGDDRVLMVNVNDPRGLRMAENLKNLDGLTKFDIAGTIVGKVTRWMASVNTQYNPAFGLVNLTRDTLGGAINLSSTKLRGKTMKVLALTPGALKGIGLELSGKKSGEWGRLFRQFQADGGQTGFRDQFRDANDRAKALESELKALEKAGKLTPGKVADKMLGALDIFNTTLENAVRLAAYREALLEGMSRPEAARLGRELTVDFNRKGRMGRELGPLYAFFNASVQGSARTLQTLAGPAGAKIIAGGVSLGVLQAIMLLAAGYDDDEVPEFVKARALIIPLGTDENGQKRHLTIPLPLGLHVLPNTGRVLAEMTLDGGKDAAKKGFEAVGEIAGAFNPLGGGNIFTGSGALRTIAPTVIDPIVETLSNENFAGTPIEREKYDNDPRPGFQRAREGTLRTPTGQTYTDISRIINKATGGDEYEAGKFSPSPEMVRYWSQVVGGGLLREVEKIVNTSIAMSKGDETKPTGFPVFGRFYGEVDDESVQRTRYYENLAAIEKAEKMVKAAEKAGDLDSAQRIEEAKPEALLKKEKNRAQKDLRELNREAMETVGDRQAIKEIDTERTAVMRDLNAAARESDRERRDGSLGGQLRKALGLADVNP